MAILKIKTSTNLSRLIGDKLDSDVRKITREWSTANAPKVIKYTKETISSGNSPVKGYKRFQDYSPSYKNAIRKGRYSRYSKRQRPVNLTLSGKMLRSFISRMTKTGFSVYFTSELAKYHNVEGAGRSKVIRRILPTGNEKFKRAIMSNLEKDLKYRATRTFGKL